MAADAERRVTAETITIPLSGGDMLNLQRFCGNPQGQVIFMLHGAIENGRIFYSENGKGLAPYLAGNGYDVFVADLRGRGKSRPAISRSSKFGQTVAITEDIPAFIDAIISLRGDAPQQWLAHSWGGVLFSSFLARFPEYIPRVDSLVYFGSKRTIRAKNIHILLQVDLVWQWLCPLSCLLAGYLPARQMGIGSDSETARSFRESATWVKHDAWVDADGFDYGAAIKKVKLPPIWYIAARNDFALGHPDDVRRFMESAGKQQCRYSVLSMQNGNLHDYDHINMLTHPDAVRDQFPMVLEWFQEHDSKESRGV